MGLNRHSIRLKGYDYSLCGSYFITICTFNKKNIFGEINNGKIIDSKFGLIVKDEWYNLISGYDKIDNSEFVLMPNHIHGILILNNQKSEEKNKLYLSSIIGAYKSITSIKCLELFKKIKPNEKMGKLWQRNYYEHIIRSEFEYNKIAEYMFMNPEYWSDDNIENLPAGILGYNGRAGASPAPTDKIR